MRSARAAADLVAQSHKRIVVVTGASSGIGEACAVRLARDGWRVLAGVRRPGDAPDGTEEVLLDVTDAEQISAVADGLNELHGLVNNAGVAVAAPLEALPLDELRRQLEVNVLGQVAVTQALLPQLRRARGRIVFVGSIAGRSALPFLGAYAASKHALEAIADSLRVELAPWEIAVSVVEPATIRARIWSTAAATAEEIRARVPPETLALYRDRVDAFGRAAAAAGRRAEPAERVADAVEHALTAERPKTRYLVGRDAKLRAGIERLPDRVRDRLYERLLLRG
jgi:NAD(P)-dependent dehydrogenase (short-subunit alcohol dehydrogenase family)